MVLLLEGLSNVLPAFELDAADATWPNEIESHTFDAVLAVNVFHAAPFGVSVVRVITREQ